MRRPFTLAIAGDVMLGRLVNEAIQQQGFAYPWGNILVPLRDADLFLVNLECALTSQTIPWQNGKHKVFSFRADPAAVETLERGRVDFVSLANNHIYDFGASGLLETVQTLDRAGIAHAGAGENLSASQEPAYLFAGDYRVAVISFADQPPEWAATVVSPGINYTPVSTRPKGFSMVKETVSAAKQQADYVIFSMHWGPNLRARPMPAFKEFARAVIDTGADVFWGHSAHIVQGIEIYKGKPILFDTGDLIDDYAVDEWERNDLSTVFLLTASPPVIHRLELLPVRISRIQVNLADGADYDFFIKRIMRLCQEMDTGTALSDNHLTINLPSMPREALGKARRRTV